MDATTDALSSSNAYNVNEPAYFGDFNGDGRADMLVMWTNTSGYRQLRIYKALSNGTLSSSTNLSSSRTNNPADYPAQFFVTDFNGDGKDDFVVHWKNSSGNRSNLVYLGKSASPYVTDTSTYALTSSVSYNASDPVLMADVNGDGLADMVIQSTEPNGSRCLWPYKAASNGTYNPGARLVSSYVQNPTEYGGQYLIGDVNGDGRDDFIVKWCNNGMNAFLTYCGTASGNFLEAVNTTPSSGIAYYCQ